jgi:hypothetical protein
VGEHVEASEPLVHLRQQPLVLRDRPEVRRQCHVASGIAQGGDDLAQLLLLGVDCAHPGPGRVERTHDGAPDSAGCAGYDDDLVLQARVDGPGHGDTSFFYVPVDLLIRASSPSRISSAITSNSCWSDVIGGVTSITVPG